ncbi:hypothetical protein D3C72_2162630 [compost metagenome]
MIRAGYGCLNQLIGFFEIRTGGTGGRDRRQVGLTHLHIDQFFHRGHRYAPSTIEAGYGPQQCLAGTGQRLGFTPLAVQQP